MIDAFATAYLQEYRQRTGIETLVLADIEALPQRGADDVLYPLGRHAYAHVFLKDDGYAYHLVEPPLAETQRPEMVSLKKRVASEAAQQGDIDLDGTLLDGITTLVKRVRPGADVRTDPIAYQVVRDMAGLGPIDALLRDVHLEDIHVVGTGEAHVIHRNYGMVRTNVKFDDPIELVRFLRVLCERIGRPVSDATPIIDAVLEDGSRLNLVYSEDVSRRGASLSVRRATDKPVSITKLIELGTISAEAAAYLWICLEQGMSLFLCGEAACGKTTTLNAILSFIDSRSKIYSAEDTPEVRPPHKIWQRLLTRETGPPESHVQMFDLLKAALRSRPDYIVVGEIRGAEGAVAFQAMQTGHPTVATFHATSPTSLVQRLGAQPISVPLAFMDNLNLALFQETRVIEGRPARRVTQIVEIAGVSPEGVIAIPVFTYDHRADQIEFKGLNNSDILENKIATVLGLEDPRTIYQELFKRRDALLAWTSQGILDGAKVDKEIAKFRAQAHGN